MAAWITVKSGHLHRVRYFRKEKLLTIEFKESTPLYAYIRVPWSTYMGLLRAKSKGEYHAAHIRGKYDYQPVSYEDARHIGLLP